jgi:N-acetylmuramate 1-kinase
MGDRYQEMLAWLGHQFGGAVPDISPASSDASFRRYWRVASAGTTRIVMDAPPDKEDCRPFIDIASRLATAGVNVPQVLAQDPEHGFLLLGDLGSCLYLNVLDAGNVDTLYDDALRTLLTVQTEGEVRGLPPYGRELLLNEMNLFPDWLLCKELDLGTSAALRKRLADTFAWLADQALAQPRVFVHRDYHSRNLMYVPEHNPGVLDFQDAVSGPITYDLVSLLKDCYVQWPLEQVETWALRYRNRASEHGLLNNIEPATFLRWFDLMGVQRHLKASGIFARLWHRDGKPGYLPDIPRTLSYITAVAPRYPELKRLHELLHTQVLPTLMERRPP